MNLKNNLIKLRKKINTIDENILNLLSKRKNIAIQIAEKKIIHQYPIRDKQREKELINQLIHIGKKYFLSENYIKEIFKIIIHHSVNIQKKIKDKNNIHDNLTSPRFSFLGPKGSYSHIAAINYAKKYYKHFSEKEYINFFEVLQSVEKKESDYAIIPLENTYSGLISESYNLLYKTNLQIIGELIIPIKHCLLVKPNTIFENIKTIYSHPQPFHQCSEFIKKFPYWKIKYTNSTTDAMQKISHMNKYDVAAIGSEETGRIYNLHTIKKQLTNQSYNSTRFIILKKNSTKIPENIPSKTILIIKTKQQSGTLSDILLIFKINNINITKIESKSYNPNNLPEDTFYIEIQENLISKNMETTLHMLKKKIISMKILGCYPIKNI